MIQNNRIVMLAGPGVSTNIIFNAVSDKFEISAVIMEGKENRKKFIKRRIRRQGFVKVSGQIIFQALVVRGLNFFSKKRIQNIIEQQHLNTLSIPSDKITNVSSVNNDGVKDLLAKINPAIIIVNGTRIISKKILAASDAVFINTHTGITPKYRGVHGAYWALVNNDEINCGVTIHIVDAGIDTGGILYQSNIKISKEDNFVTYPYLQTSSGIPLLQKAIEDVLQDKIEIKVSQGESNVWYHPAIWEYFYNLLFKKVK